MEESLNTIPLFMRYFAFHESLVLACGALHYLHANTGVLCLSVLPGLSIIGIFIHFITTQFDKGVGSVERAFFSMRHYVVAVCVLLVGMMSIYAIYHTNTYLSTLVPQSAHSYTAESSWQLIGEILQFPHTHSMKQADGEEAQKPFNYRISFVGSVIAPIIEESFKFLLLSLTFPLTFIWAFVYNKVDRNALSTYSDYCAQSVFVMFVALCGGCGIAIMENVGYLAACHWPSTREYCLPNKNFDILGAGLARGIFSVPFHCVTACIMADTVCAWMNAEIACFHRNKFMIGVKFVLSYPISIVFPIFLHSSFNYWMKGIPFMTGIITVVGFAFLSSRVAAKWSYLESVGSSTRKKAKNSDECESIDITLSEPYCIEDLEDIPL